MKNVVEIREEIRAVLNRILDEEFESVVSILRESENLQIKDEKNKKQDDSQPPL